MAYPTAPFVLFAAAAGPDLGFGHLVRAGILADALGVSRHIVLRGTSAAIETAIRFGWTVHRGPAVLDHLQPDLLVVDEPSPAEVRRWVERAHRVAVPVATIHDGGSARAAGDMVIDGSLMAAHVDRPTRASGPTFALLDAGIASLRADRTPPEPYRVLIALGGGTHVRRFGVAIAKSLAAAVPSLDVLLAAGFVSRHPLPSLPAGCRWLHAPDGLAPHLTRAGVVVVAGGITLYEACALGCATVAVPVVEAQRPAILAAARAGAVMAPGARHRRLSAGEVVRAVTELVANPATARTYRRRARQLLDGRGAERVADRLLTLIEQSATGEWHHAA